MGDGNGEHVAIGATAREGGVWVCGKNMEWGGRCGG